MTRFKYAIQHKVTGEVIDYCNTKEQAKFWLDEHPNIVELIDITNASKISVEYTELGGPWGYGHQEISFESYGGLKRCIIRLYQWMQREASVWGPDVRDIRDYFRHCSLTVNGVNKTSWLLKQVEKLDKNIIYV